MNGNVWVRSDNNMIGEVPRENLRSAIGYEHWTPMKGDCDALDAAEKELRRLNAEGIQPEQVSEIPTERQHLESLQARVPASQVLPLPGASESLHPVLYPPQHPELTDAGDRPLTGVVQPFESEIEVDEQEFDELQR